MPLVGDILYKKTYKNKNENISQLRVNLEIFFFLELFIIIYVFNKVRKFVYTVIIIVKDIMYCYTLGRYFKDRMELSE